MPKLFIKEGESLEVDDKATLQVTNLEEFLNALSRNSGHIPAPHAVYQLQYKLVVDNQEYFGKTICDTYNPKFKNEMDEGCPYVVEVINWKLGKDNPAPYIEFDVKLKN